MEREIINGIGGDDYMGSGKVCHLPTHCISCPGTGDHPEFVHFVLVSVLPAFIWAAPALQVTPTSTDDCLMGASPPVVDITSPG